MHNPRGNPSKPLSSPHRLMSQIGPASCLWWNGIQEGQRQEKGCSQGNNELEGKQPEARHWQGITGISYLTSLSATRVMGKEFCHRVVTVEIGIAVTVASASPHGPHWRVFTDVESCRSIHQYNLGAGQMQLGTRSTDTTSSLAHLWHPCSTFSYSMSRPCTAN